MKNWRLWTGFVLSIAAFISYFAFFYRFPITRGVPWVNFILFVVATVLLIAGVRRAESAGLHSARLERQERHALRASGELAARRASRFLSRLLVTLLQLRVTGYRTATHSF